MVGVYRVADAGLGRAQHREGRSGGLWSRRADRFAYPALIAAIAAAVIFYRLGTPAVYWWDEARIAINSLEMMQHPGLVVTFHERPDLWNTKPPLATWLNAISMALFGVNEWALRLPAALASVGTVTAVALFVRRRADDATGLLAALILLGCGGFVEVHVARTADFDALLVLFTSLMAFAVAEKRYRSAGFMLGAALLTKGVAALFFVPGFAPQWKRLAVPFAVSVGVFFIFLAAREIVAPGYLTASYVYDFSRFGAAADGHSGSPLYYVRYLMDPWQIILGFPLTEAPYVASAFPWALFALLGFRRDAVTFALISLLVVTAVASTKLAWYIAPAYPLIAALAAMGMRRYRLLFLAAFPLAILCVGANVWKIEKEMGTLYTSVEQRQPNLMKRGQPYKAEFQWKTPSEHGMEPYHGPAEFYARKASSGQ